MRAMLIAVLALAAACASPQQDAEPAPANAALAQSIRADLDALERELAAPGVVAAGIGQVAYLGDGLSIRPLEVIEDSRCPANVQCVWAGRLRVRAEAAGAVRELTLGETLETPRGTVLFAVASPGAWAQWPETELPRPAYRFGFRRE